METPPLPRTPLRTLLTLARTLRRRTPERDLDDEIGAYVDARTDAHMRSGLSPADARRTALVEIGGLAQVREEMRAVHPWHEVEMFWRDVCFGSRTILRSPAFAGVVVLTLALGVGAAVMMFSVLQAVMWRALPYPNSDRLVAIEASFGPITDGGLSAAEFDRIRDSKAFSHVGVANAVDAFITVGDEMERVSAASATDDVLPLLGGVPLTLGRPLRSATDVNVASGSVRAVVISHRLWRGMFHGDPGVIGRRVEVNNLDVEVVGVLPDDLQVWLPGTTGVAEQTDVWFPKRLDELVGQDRWPAAIASLAPGVRLGQSQAELDILTKTLQTDSAASYANAVGEMRLHARLLRDVVAAPVARGLVALGIAVVFVLFVACVNLANLMLARAQSREREVATRVALGATQFRILRQFVTEHLVLAIAGGVAALVVGRVGMAWLDWLGPAHLPRQAEIALDATTAVAAVGLSAAAVVAAGLIATLGLGRRSGSHLAIRSSASASGGHRLQRALVIAEVALSIAPLFAAGLMMRSFINQSLAPLGFDPSNVLTAKAGISFRKFPDVDARWALYRAALDAVGDLPGAVAVSGASPLPFDRAALPPVRRFRRADNPAAPAIPATQQSVLPGYLAVTRTPLLHGRDFTDEDISGRRNVAIVDEYFAQRLGVGSAVGRRFVAGAAGRQQTLEIIGVTRHARMMRVLDAARTSVRDEALPHVFVPFHLFPAEMTLVVRTNGDTTALTPAVKRTVEGLGTRAVYDIRPFDTYVAGSMDDTRFSMLLLAVLATVSLLLAAIGLYGTLAYLTSRRTQEFGIRMALGASAGQIVALVAREGALLTGVGGGLGILGALAAARALSHLLYNVAPVDWTTLAAVVGLVAIVALGAISHPAWRAAGVDPNAAINAP